jgi:hypothetical protein
MVHYSHSAIDSTRSLLAVAYPRPVSSFLGMIRTKLYQSLFSDHFDFTWVTKQEQHARNRTPRDVIDNTVDHCQVQNALNILARSRLGKSNIRFILNLFHTKLAKTP